MTAQWRMPSCGVEPLPKYTERHRMWRPYYYTEIHVIDKELTPRMVRHTLLQVRMGESERSVPQTTGPRSEASAATRDSGKPTSEGPSEAPGAADAQPHASNKEGASRGDDENRDAGDSAAPKAETSQAPAHADGEPTATEGTPSAKGSADVEAKSQRQDCTDAEKSEPPGPAGPVKKRSSNLGTMAQQTKRKKKSSLAEMSAAATAKPVKLNTLEKSKADWEAFKGTRNPVDASESGSKDTMSEAEREELDAQTHGGSSGLGSMKGYIHRKEFLDRVHGRLDDQEQQARYTR